MHDPVAVDQQYLPDEITLIGGNENARSAEILRLLQSAQRGAAHRDEVIVL
jgi:hypothetical protein